MTCKCGRKCEANSRFCRCCSYSTASRDCLIRSCIYAVNNGVDWFCKHHEKMFDRQGRRDIDTFLDKF